MSISPPGEWPSTDRDDHFMAMALRLAARGLGQVWPNPTVGCVLTRDHRVVGRGWTQPGGRPHGEVEALRRAGEAALGATAYVSLEPCAHYGHTPPCTMALLQAGVRRVVVATTDPDPRVDGAGLRQLRQAGVEVRAGVRQVEAEALNAGFLLKVRARRPLITLKLATSLDGRIATRTGASQWITGSAARAEAHALRARHDAIMVGSGTALTDDPELTCRLPGLAARSPVRVVLDGGLRLSPDSRLAESARATPVWLFTRKGASPQSAHALGARGVEVIEIASDRAGGLDLRTVATALAERGITRIMVEGGGRLAGSLLRHQLVDRLVWVHAPMVIGGDGLPAVAAMEVSDLAEARIFTRADHRSLAQDVLGAYIGKAR